MLKKISTTMLSPKVIRKFIPPNVIEFKSVTEIYSYNNKIEKLRINYDKINNEERHGKFSDQLLYKYLLKSDAFSIIIR